MSRCHRHHSCCPRLHCHWHHLCTLLTSLALLVVPPVSLGAAALSAVVPFHNPRPSTLSDPGSNTNVAAEALVVPRPDAASGRPVPSSSTTSSASTYAIVVDAGSSGSRIQIYRLTPSSSSSSSPLPIIEPALHPTRNDWQLKAEPGLSSFARHLADLPAALQPLLDFARETVPEHLHATTPIRVLATAGMRLLHLQDQTAILDHVCQVLALTPFAHHPQGCHRTVRVISGEDEGMYGWLALNYLADTLTRGQTLGFLDMGGASTQIAYALPHAGTPNRNVYKTLYLPSSSSPSPVAVDMHVTTYLGMGTNEARKTHVHLLTQDHPGGSHILDPCLPRGLSVTDELNAWHPGGDVALVGQGDWRACLALARTQLMREAPDTCTRAPCLDPAGAHVNQTFVGVSEYWYSTHDLLGMGGAYVPEVMAAAAVAQCALPWDSDAHVRAVRGGVTTERLRDQCFKSAWLAAVLHTGFGVPEQALSRTPNKDEGVCQVDEAEVMGGKHHAPHPPPTHIQAGWHLPGFGAPAGNASTACVKPQVKVVTSDHVGEMQITWTLGSLVYEALPHVETPPEPIVPGDTFRLRHPTATVGAQITLVSLAFVLVAGLAFVYTRRRSRRSAATAAYYAHYYSGTAGGDPLRVKIKVWTGRMKAAVQSRMRRPVRSSSVSSSSSSAGSGADAEYHVPMMPFGEASALRPFGGEQQDAGSRASLRGML